MFNNIFILKMKKVFFFTFLAIGMMMSACELSPEEIQPVGKIILETEVGGSGEDPIPAPPPDPNL